MRTREKKLALTDKSTLNKKPKQQQQQQPMWRQMQRF
jgi:hypothetical protein